MSEQAKKHKKHKKHKKNKGVDGPTTAYGKRYRKALVMSAELHADQYRKGTSIPYISHLLHVSALVWEHGGTEIQASAALLHDAVEDIGGEPLLAEIRDVFGDEVAAIVQDCSDTTQPDLKEPWRQRKEAYISHIAHAGEASLLVSVSDKVHNAESLLSDLRLMGPGMWDRFTADAEGTVWYHQSLHAVFAERLGSDDALVRRYDAAIAALAWAVGVDRSRARPPQAEPVRSGD